MNTMEKCWQEMCEDDSQVKVPDLINEYWLGILKDGVYVGFFRIAQITSVLFDCHVCILKEHRRNVVEYAKKAYRWILEYLPAQKLMVSIPEFNKKAIAYSKKIGFIEQGFNSDSYIRNGELCGMIQLGITRRDMEVICQEQR